MSNNIDGFIEADFGKLYWAFVPDGLDNDYRLCQLSIGNYCPSIQRELPVIIYRGLHIYFNMEFRRRNRRWYLKWCDFYNDQYKYIHDGVSRDKIKSLAIDTLNAWIRDRNKRRHSDAL